MTYTIQCVSESGSLGEGKLQYANNKREIRDALDNWVDLHDRVGSDPALASVLVWRGRLEDVTDIYPDFEAKLGSRGGFQLNEC